MVQPLPVSAEPHKQDPPTLEVPGSAPSSPQEALAQRCVTTSSSRGQQSRKYVFTDEWCDGVIGQGRDVDELKEVGGPPPQLVPVSGRLEKVNANSPSRTLMSSVALNLPVLLLCCCAERGDSAAAAHRLQTLRPQKSSRRSLPLPTWRRQRPLGSSAPTRLLPQGGFALRPGLWRRSILPGPTQPDGLHRLRPRELSLPPGGHEEQPLQLRQRPLVLQKLRLPEQQSAPCVSPGRRGRLRGRGEGPGGEVEGAGGGAAAPTRKPRRERGCDLSGRD